MLSANENKKKAQEMILTQEKRLKEDYDRAIENMKLTLNSLTTQKFSEQIEKVSKKILEGENIKEEIKVKVLESLNSKNEEINYFINNLSIRP
jgi:citrate lyase gamma subunit